uniref:Phospholipase A2 n=1 Tax=Salvator merianae TaxID=96440 RepID=A0A8D0BU54_SALMN
MQFSHHVCSALLPLLFCVDANIFQLSKMIKKVTGRAAFPTFSTYGCYCGLGGKGRPLDRIDWCCHEHDCCYGRTDENGCSSKFITYHYTYRLGIIKCGNSLQCEYDVCECDRKFVQCLKKYLKNYEELYTFFPNDFCQGRTPQC